VAVVGSEIVGLVPMGALIDTAAYYLQLENFKTEQCWKQGSMSKIDSRYSILDR